MNSKSRRQPFKPSWWCPGPHTQTILARFFRAHDKVHLKREILPTPDGDILELDFLEGQAGAPWVVVLHGLEGSSRTPYVMSLLTKIRSAGWSACAMNFRGCGDLPNKLRSTYHSGKTGDLDIVLTHVLRRAGTSSIYLAGFSIGGNIVLKWLGERGENARPVVRKAAAVSVPYNLVKSVELMDKGFNREVYTRSLLSSLKRKALEKARQYPGIMNVQTVKNCKTFGVFDREVTARLNGFRDEVHYWSDSSSSRYLKNIRVPSLLIHAADDPFFPAQYFPHSELAGHPYLESLMTQQGGHLGFMAGVWPWRQEPWLENRILDFFQQEDRGGKA